MTSQESKKTREEAQLDLLKTTAEIPQANSIQLFLSVIQHIFEGITSIEDLAIELLVDLRTVRYYIEFARWLKFAYMPEQGKIKLSEIGHVFGKNHDMRARLFRDALFARSLVKDIQKIKRDTQNPDTKKAAVIAIQSRSSLADATVNRRASGITTMLDIAYQSSTINWSTGDSLPQETKAYEFEGRAFLTAMAARSFGGEKEIGIGFPVQVCAFVIEQEHLSDKIWAKASQKNGDHPWFGNVPVNPSTLATVKRGGPDLRSLLVQTCPYVTLSLSMLSLSDRLHRPLVRWSSDMYGVRVWYHDRDIGTPFEVIDRFCQAHSIKVETLRTEPLYSPQASDRDLLALLQHTGLVRIDDTMVKLAKQFNAESRNASEDSSSSHDRLILLEDLWEGIL